MSDALEADFVIVGAGSAGCALAYRLSEDGRNSVLLIEGGGSDIGPFIQMPAALSYPMNMARYDWGYSTAPEPHLGGRRLVVPRGRVIGGSSSINGMVYVRGHKLDFDGWEADGARGWGFADVLPYYMRMEHAHGGEADWRGHDGPVHITRGPRRNPLYHAFVDAGKEAGYGETADYNGYRQEGFGPMEMTIWRGRRWSAANAYLKPARKRKNLRILSGTTVRRVTMDGTKATGVEINRRGKVQTIVARREVILSASAINSPKILMLSGIGDGERLKNLGIEVKANRPGVGQNLQDHLEIYLQAESLKPVTLYAYNNLIGKALIGAQWLFTKTGLGATNHFESAAFIRSKAGVRYPDIQYHFLPLAVRYDGTSAVKAHGFQVHVGPMRSKSRGHVKLNSADPTAAPEILFNYMSEESDWEDFRACVRLTREILKQPAFKDYMGREITPGPDANDDAAIDEFVREEVESAYHPCGTCRMGAADDPLAVVDPECRVIGIENLRVVDSSIFPRITNGNLNAPSIMVGEKASDLILGREPLPRDEREAWIHPEWQTKQR